MGCRGNDGVTKYALFICVEEGVRPSDAQRQAIPDAVEAWIADTTARGDTGGRLAAGACR